MKMMKSKLKEFKSDTSQWLIDNVIILKLKKEAEKKSKCISSNVVEGFSAKLLSTEQDKHSVLLKEAINDNSIFNIALSGPYGSGKTSIIKTFKNRYSLKYIDISLATFDDKFTNAGSTLKLEYCILKQLFYKVHPNKVPESRFKRIVNHKGIGLKSFSS
jgi:septin family protein